jgi:hypothetical protein
MASMSAAPAPSSRADVVYVLVLLQVAFVLLAAVGEVLLMAGNGAYFLMPVVKSAVLLWLATKVVSGRRWAMITLIVLQAVTLTGFVIQLLIGLSPALDFTVNLVGLLTGVVMPVVILRLCWRMAAQLRRARQTRRAQPGIVGPVPAFGVGTMMNVPPAYDPYPTDTLPGLDPVSGEVTP